MTLSEIKHRIKTHHSSYKHLCNLRLEGNKLVIRHDRTSEIYLWDNSKDCFMIPSKYLFEVGKYLNELK
jgi:hypothetical protein